MDSSDLIKALDLIPLEPEGGYFRQIYKSKNLIHHPQTGEMRPAMTSIYYLLDKKTFSAFHRLRSDEIYHFYSGDSVELFLLDDSGKLEVIKLGSNPHNGEVSQYHVSANVWQASCLTENGNYALLGTTMSPGYDDKDFELAKREVLLEKAPQLKALINNLCRV